jgi:hypothetical protein
MVPKAASAAEAEANNRSSLSSSASRSYCSGSDGRSEKYRRRTDNNIAVRSPLYPPLLSSQQQMSYSGVSGGDSVHNHFSSSSSERARKYDNERQQQQHQQQQQRRLNDPYDRGVVMSQLTIDSSMRSQVTFNDNCFPSLEQPSTRFNSSSMDDTDAVSSSRNSSSARKRQLQQQQLDSDRAAAASRQRQQHSSSASSSSIFNTNCSRRNSILKTSTSHKHHRSRHRSSTTSDHSSRAGSSTSASRVSTTRSALPHPNHHHHHHQNYSSSAHCEAIQEPIIRRGQNQVFTPSRRKTSSLYKHDIGRGGTNTNTTPGSNATSLSLLQQDAVKRINNSPSSTFLRGPLNVPYPQLSKYREELAAQLANTQLVPTRDYRTIGCCAKNQSSSPIVLLQQPHFELKHKQQQQPKGDNTNDNGDDEHKNTGDDDANDGVSPGSGRIIHQRTSSSNNSRTTNDLFYLAQDSISEASSVQNNKTNVLPIQSHGVGESSAVVEVVPPPQEGPSCTAVAISRSTMTNNNSAIHRHQHNTTTMQEEELGCNGRNIMDALNRLLAKKKLQMELDLQKFVQEQIENKLNEKFSSINDDMDTKVKIFEGTVESKFQNLLDDTKKIAISELTQKVEELTNDTKAALDERLKVTMTDLAKTTESTLKTKLQNRFEIMETEAQSRIDQKVIQVERSLQKKASDTVEKLQNKLSDYIDQLRRSVPRLRSNDGGWDDVKKVTSLVLQNCHRAFTNTTTSSSSLMMAVPNTKTSQHDSTCIQLLQSTDGWTVKQKSIAASPSDKSSPCCPPISGRRSKTSKTCHSEQISSPLPTIGSKQPRTEMDFYEEVPLSKRTRSSSSSRTLRAQSLNTQNPIKNSAQKGSLISSIGPPSCQSLEKERVMSASECPLKRSMGETQALNKRKKFNATDQHDEYNRSKILSNSEGIIINTKKIQGGFFPPTSSKMCEDANDSKIDENHEKRTIKPVHNLNNGCVGSSVKIGNNGNNNMKHTPPIHGFATTNRRLVSPHLDGPPTTTIQKKSCTTLKQIRSSTTKRTGFPLSSNRTPSKNGSSGTRTPPQGHRYRRRKNKIVPKKGSTEQISTQDVVAATKKKDRCHPLTPDSTNNNNRVPVPLEVVADFGQVLCPSPLDSFPFSSPDIIVDTSKISIRPNSEKAIDTKNVPTAGGSGGATISTTKMKGRMRLTYGRRRRPFGVTSPNDKIFSFE